jgi:hypothetical protein
MALRFVGIDPNTDLARCPIVWADEESGELVAGLEGRPCTPRSLRVEHSGQRIDPGERRSHQGSGAHGADDQESVRCSRAFRRSVSCWPTPVKPPFIWKCGMTTAPTPGWKHGSGWNALTGTTANCGGIRSTNPFRMLFRGAWSFVGRVLFQSLPANTSAGSTTRHKGISPLGKKSVGCHGAVQRVFSCPLMTSGSSTGTYSACTTSRETEVTSRMNSERMPRRWNSALRRLRSSGGKQPRTVNSPFEHNRTANLCHLLRPTLKLWAETRDSRSGFQRCRVGRARWTSSRSRTGRPTSG